MLTYASMGESKFKGAGPQIIINRVVTTTNFMTLKGQLVGTCHVEILTVP